VRIIDFSAERARAITGFSSSGATSVHCGDGEGDAHIYYLRFEPGGAIGPHPAGYDQLLLVVTGSGWAAGEDGTRSALTEGQAAYFRCGEIHSKGSDSGMTAIMVQASELLPVVPAS
jgi:quercetin dioxygenase-like cupin family protein